MVAKKQQLKLNRKSRIAICSTLGLMMFFCNFTTLSNASPSETKQKMRLPSAVHQQIVFDCANPPANLEVSTPSETIRLEAKNCSSPLSFIDERLHQPLVIFPAGTEKFSSEFAYLKKGSNAFSVTLGKKSYTVSVLRF